MMRSSHYWLLLPLVAGCDPAAAAPTPAHERSAAASAPEESAIPVASPSVRETSADAAEDEAATPKRGELRGGEPVERIPRWPDADPSALALADLDPELQRAVEASPVPVLVAPGPWLEDLVVIPLGDQGYSLRARAGKSKLILQASKRARLYADMPGAKGTHALRGGRGQMTINEGIRSASWIEAGVAYTADLECGDPEASECSSDEGFAALVDRLVFVATDTKGSTPEEPGR